MASADLPAARDTGSLRAEALRDAFRELHGRRLHGFVLLLTLGDRALAARLTADALAEGVARAEELRHPERAAAWLRARVVRSMPRRHTPPSPAEERAALDLLAVDRTTVDGLAALSVRERAALVATEVERLDARDVETVIGHHGTARERVLARARRRFLAAAGRGAPAPAASVDGPLVRRIHAVAARMMT